MGSDLFGILELFFIFGIVLALAIAELISLHRKTRRTDKASGAGKPGDPPA